MVRVKAKLGGDMRRFVLADNGGASPSFGQLCAQLRAVYGAGDFVVKYTDDEGDVVTVTCDAELTEAVLVAGDGGLLRIDVLPSDQGMDVDAPSSALPATPSASTPTTPQLNTPAQTTSAPRTPPRSPVTDAGPGGAQPSVPPHDGPPHPPFTSRPSARRTPRDTSAAPTTELPSQASSCPPSAAAPAAPAAAARPSPSSQHATDPLSPNTSRRSSGAGPSSRPNPGGGASWNLEFDTRDVLDGLSGIFTRNFGSLGSLGALSGWGGGGGGDDGEQSNGRGRLGGEWTRREWLEMFGVSEEEWGQFMRTLNPRSLGGRFADISDTTMDALRVLMASLMRSPGAMALMSAVPVALPALRAFLAELQAGVAVTPERVEALGATLSAALTAAIGAENARRIADFAHTAAQDEAVLALLRRVSEMRPPSWGGASAAAADAAAAAADATRGANNAATEAVGRVERAMSVLGRLDVHTGIACVACGTTPIVGVRYWCTSTAGHDLCAQCHANDSTDLGGRDYHAIEYPWEAELGRTLVPRPVLSYGARGNEVMFLQHLLTQLGYMTPADYRIRTGFYGPRTAAAVNAMRRACGLSIQGTYGLYDEVAAASLLSIVEAGIPPATAAGQAQQSDPSVQSEDTPAAA